MATKLARPDRLVGHSLPLIRSYWVMPLAAGLAVILVAAGMLTEVLVLANRIDSNVTPIRASTASIQVHAAGIAALDKVDASAKGIKAAADPLSTQAATILTTVGAIQATVGRIDAATGSISGHAASISGTVDSIAPHVRLIAEPLDRIITGLHTTIADLDTVLSLVGGVKGDTGALLSQALLPTIDDHAQSIDCQVHGADCGNP